MSNPQEHTENDEPVDEENVLIDTTGTSEAEEHAGSGPASPKSGNEAPTTIDSTDDTVGKARGRPQSQFLADRVWCSEGFEPFVGDPVPEVPQIDRWIAEPGGEPEWVNRDRPRDLRRYPTMKPPWVKPPKHWYGETSTHYEESGWRYDVITDVEDYRISTIPEDFIGTCNSTTPWTDAVKSAYNNYKASEHISNILGRIATALDRTRPLDDPKAQLYFMKIRWTVAIRAATQRTDILRRWPCAFEGHGGTAGHWHWAKKTFETAESIRLEARKVLEDTRPELDPQNLSCDWAEEALRSLRVRILGEVAEPQVTEPAVADVEEDWHFLSSRENIETAVRAMPDLLGFTGPAFDSSPDWMYAEIHASGRRGKPVYALHPAQYEHMRGANQQLKDDLRNAFNDQSRPDVTMAEYPEACFQDLPPIKADLANTYDQNIDTYDISNKMMCNRHTFSALAGFWRDKANSNGRI